MITAWSLSDLECIDAWCTRSLPTLDHFIVSYTVNIYLQLIAHSHPLSMISIIVYFNRLAQLFKLMAKTIVWGPV